MAYDVGLMLDWMEESFDTLPDPFPEVAVLASIERYYPKGLRGFVADPPKLCHTVQQTHQPTNRRESS